MDSYEYWMIFLFYIIATVLLNYWKYRKISAGIYALLLVNFMFIVNRYDYVIFHFIKNDKLFRTKTIIL